MDIKKIRSLAIVIVVICGICSFIFAIITWQLEYFGVAIALFAFIGSSAALTTGKFTSKHLSAVVFLITSLVLLIGFLLWLFGSAQIKNIMKANMQWLISGGLAVFSVLVILNEFIGGIWRKKVCTQAVMAECIDVEIRRGYNRSIRPIFSFYYDGENHIMMGGCTSKEFLFKKGESYELMIDPNDMTTFYYASKKYNESLYVAPLGILAFAGVILGFYYIK